MARRVVIVGSGIAGLTVAHELVERGFEVHVYERREEVGGKATSRLVQREDNDADKAWNSLAVNTRNRIRDSKRPGLPVEHGFRFFPSWYRHLIDTMKRIPYRKDQTEYQGTTVFDNLVTVESNLMAWSNRPPVPLPMHLPRNLGQVGTVAAFVAEFGKLGISAEEAFHFLTKLGQIALADRATSERLHDVSWWQFIDAQEKSQAFQELMRATTQTMVAARAEEANAATIGRLALRTLMDVTTSVDRILDGPTQIKFLDPWYRHLDGLGVHFHFGVELDAIEFEDEEPKIRALTFRAVQKDHAIRLRRLLRSIRYRKKLIRDAFEGGPEVRPFELDARRDARKELADELRSARDLLEEVLRLWKGDNKDKFEGLRAWLVWIETMSVLSGFADDLAVLRWDAINIKKETGQTWRPAGDTLKDYYDAISQWVSRLSDQGDLSDRLEKIGVPESKSEPNTTEAEGLLIDVETQPSERVGDGAVFVLAIPVEQLAYHVHRSVTLRTRAPELTSVIPLADNCSWMAGIQFYLKEPFDFAPGHVVSMDSPWALTFIEQKQFWTDAKQIEPSVKSVISVDIAEWGRRGRFVQKEAYNCDAEEVAREVWEELKRMTAPTDRQPRLRDDMLLSVTGPVTGAVTLRRGVDFNLDESIADIYDRKKQAAYERARGVLLGREDITPGDEPVRAYSWGKRRNYNVDPILVNRVGTRSLRPGATTAIHNLFLAGDYLRTETDLACMEGANESGRRAVNAVLASTGSRERPCQLWEFDRLSSAAASVFQLPSIGVMRGTVDAAGTVVGAALRGLGRFFGGPDKQ